MAKRVRMEDIDENFIISSFVQNEPPPEIPPPPAPGAEMEIIDEKHNVQAQKSNSAPTPESLPAKEEPRKRRTKSQDYESLFLKEATIPARIGKTVYIRKEYHDRIQKVVRVIALDEVSLFSYIDNVLAHHFAAFQEEITELYNQNNKSIF